MATGLPPPSEYSAESVTNVFDHIATQGIKPER